MASGSGVCASALTESPESRMAASAACLACCTLRHRFGEVFRDLVEEARGREPALIGADQQCEVLGHEAGLDGVDADLFQGQCELRQRLVVVELGAMRQAARPGK